MQYPMAIWNSLAALETWSLYESLMSNDDLPESEVVKRRDAALLRALSTPHKKQADMKVGRGKKGETDKADARPGSPKRS